MWRKKPISFSKRKYYHALLKESKNWDSAVLKIAEFLIIITPLKTFFAEFKGAPSRPPFSSLIIYYYILLNDMSHYLLLLLYTFWMPGSSYLTIIVHISFKRVCEFVCFLFVFKFFDFLAFSNFTKENDEQPLKKRWLLWMQETEVKEKKRRTQETEIVFSRLDSCCCKLCT